MNLTEQLKKKVAKVKLKETGAYVSISAGDLIYDILRVDPRAVQGVDFVRKDDLSDVFSFGKKEILERKEKSAESLEGLHNTYTGYTFERVVALDFQKRGAEVVFPENARQSGYDLIINGEKFQVKTEENGISLIEDHFEKYPYRVIANSEAAEKFIEKYPDKAHLVINSGFSHDEAQNLVKESLDAGVEIFEDNNLFGSAIPEILGIVSIISIGKNFMYWADGKTDMNTALKNIAIDSVGKFAGAGVGAKIGSFFLPPFGTIVGGGLGFMFGGSVANSYKIETYCKDEIDELEKDIDKYIKKSQSIMKKNEKIFKKKEDYIINELKKKKNDTARRYARKIEEFEEFISKKLKHERDVKKISSRRFELYFRDAKKGLEKFIQLNRKLEDKLDLVNYNEFALETLKVSSKGGVGPEFMPKESKKLFESVKKFMKAAKKQGV